LFLSIKCIFGFAVSLAESWCARDFAESYSLELQQNHSATNISLNSFYQMI